MPELLIELGCEELPASFVRGAYEQLQSEVETRLRAANLSFGAVVSLGTPRRLIVSVQDLVAMQPDQNKDVRGPAVKAAFDESGNPTKALEGFCRSQGVDVATVRKEGDYAWITKFIPGVPTIDVLKTLIPESILALQFEKSMRWGSSGIRYARPIRWILAAFDGNSVDFQIESVVSGTQSRGHRFNAPESFEATRFDELLSALRSRQVEPCPDARRTRIIEGATTVASGKPMMTEALIDENVFLTEWPMALEGDFKPEFGNLPEPVLITAMAKHERFFPVVGPDGKLLTKFISIRNGGEEATVRNGNAWVLNARFNDAKFFFDEDSRFTMDQFLAKTEKMLFQEKLGTVRQRADRLAALAEFVAVKAGASTEQAAAAQKAGLYAKADLVTGLVSELSSLQGVVGGEYAKREGFETEVCDAIRDQYSHEKISGESVVSRSLIAADQLDKLAGYLGQGLSPSGSSDPFGLRRAVTILIELAKDWTGLKTSYSDLLSKAFELYSAQGIALDPNKAAQSLTEIFVGRYKALMNVERHDVLEAAMLADNLGELSSPRRVSFRIEAIQQAISNPSFLQTVTRPLNIVSAAKSKGIQIATEIGELDSNEISALAQAHRATVNDAQNAADSLSPEAFVAAITKLLPAVNAAFDNAMVMVDDEKLRSNRLAVMDQLGATLRLGGDWTKVNAE